MVHGLVCYCGVLMMYMFWCVTVVYGLLYYCGVCRVCYCDVWLVFFTVMYGLECCCDVWFGVLPWCRIWCVTMVYGLLCYCGV